MRELKRELQKGDIVIASTVLAGEKEYPVLRIEGNKAITKFRTFNKKIYPGGNVYEIGGEKTSNGYWLKDKHVQELPVHNYNPTVCVFCGKDTSMVSTPSISWLDELYKGSSVYTCDNCYNFYHTKKPITKSQIGQRRRWWGVNSG